MTAADTLARGLEVLGWPLGADQQKQLLEHLAMVAKWGRVYNLTAVRDPQEMLTHHLLDSLAAVPPLARHWSATLRAGQGVLQDANPVEERGATQPPPLRVLDVGAGAGFPGIPFAIALPPEWRVQVMCVDAVAKKAGFMRQVAAELGLSNLQAVHGRIESLSLPAADVITCRAFSSLADCVRLTATHLAPQGVWMALKGQRPDQEIEALPADVEVFHVEPLEVPFLSAQRCVVWMRPRSRSI